MRLTGKRALVTGTVRRPRAVQATVAAKRPLLRIGGAHLSQAYDALERFAEAQAEELGRTIGPDQIVLRAARRGMPSRTWFLVAPKS